MFKRKRLLALSATNKLLFSLAVADLLAGIVTFSQATAKSDPYLKNSYCYRILVEIFATSVSSSVSACN